VASPEFGARRGAKLLGENNLRLTHIGITDILSQRYRYIVDLKKRHGPSLLTSHTPVSCGLGRGRPRTRLRSFFFLRTWTVRASKLHSAYKFKGNTQKYKRWQNYKPVYFYCTDNNHMESNKSSCSSAEVSWKIEQLEDKGARAPVHHSWRRQ